MCAAPATAQKFYTYVGQIETRSVLLAWGTAHAAGNTIGRNSASHGRAEISLGGRTLFSEKNWIAIDGLDPDREYAYEVRLGSHMIGEGRVRTYPENARKLTFFVIGDWGNGSLAQYQIADAMWKEFERREHSDSPVRFVLTTGDNIYGTSLLGRWVYRSGSADRHWRTKFFEPYEPLLRRIPFYPAIGNHDGDESEVRADLTVYLDNFFFPHLQAARYYSFGFGNLAEFFALDTTSNVLEPGEPVIWAENGAQHRWLEQRLSASRAPWKVPYFHHPLFTAGPRHPSNHDALSHFLHLFQKTGVRVVFNGHEHNLQISERNARSGGILFVVTGAGGELRRGNITRYMEASNVAGWAPAHHFVIVEIEDRAMRLAPAGYQPVQVRDRLGRELKMPLELKLP